MKNILITVCALVMCGCASKNYEPTKTIYNESFSLPKDNSTHVRVHRIKQISGSFLGENCPLVLKVDGDEVAGLKQNQYIDLYLPKGKHSLSVRFKCAITNWKKSLELDANGSYQEYEAEAGAAGQYRMWRKK